MKEIGEKLKEARESIGISIEEAATDLKTTKTQLINIEQGDMNAFKDVLNLKYLIRDYAKYLGLDKEDMVDEFNEYIFDYTSKISLDDIKNAKKQKENKGEQKIKSPYTTIKEKKKINYIYLIISIIVIVILCVLIFFYIDVSKKKDSNVITYTGGSINAII